MSLVRCSICGKRFSPPRDHPEPTSGLCFLCWLRVRDEAWRMMGPTDHGPGNRDYVINAEMVDRRDRRAEKRPPHLRLAEGFRLLHACGD